MPSRECTSSSDTFRYFSLGDAFGYQVSVLVLQTFSCIYCVYRFYYRWNPDLSRKLVILCVLYHIWAWLFILEEVIYIIGILNNWTYEIVEFCSIALAILSFTQIIAYIISMILHAYIAHTKKKKKKYIYKYLLRLVIVFEDSLFGISKRSLKMLHIGYSMGALITLGLCCWMATAANCVWSFPVLDRDIIRPISQKVKTTKLYWTCELSPIVFDVAVIFGAIVSLIINASIVYMYLSRMIQTIRSIQRNEELDAGQLPYNASDTPLGDTPFSVATRQMLSHVTKFGIIAFTSIFSTMLSSLIVIITSNIFSTEADFWLNGILIFCSFTFGEKLYNFLFGWCNKFLEKKISSILGHANQPHAIEIYSQTK
ncbi:hypothetical protein RFI_04666 [Reticulomyxa filosa]|uniref:Uncharacterized protein n=1 Tax=Reticulomyxa filosa TaxID=46433 RepID=X6P302_RETFI|nr:hypothetical protein RFI_04666 [Reticulomyxa filosa]|eukprot:ETO32454.1 hypothetical protein RFI_04666 [Reticulomyxa filosa]